MQSKKTKFIFLILISLAFVGLQAQIAIPASGGEASGDGGSVSYSIGQLAYTTDAEANGSIAQGVQQPYEISVVTTIDQEQSITLESSVYPNPATDYLTLKVSNTDSGDNSTSNSLLSFQLFDMNGTLLISKDLAGSNETGINMDKYVPATYFLKLFRDNKEIKTYKIIKNRRK